MPTARSFLPSRRSASARRLAWIVAIGADATQVVLFPLFGEGFVSVANDVLDVVVGLVLLLLLGWHVAFVPTLFAELIPGFDLVPTWTAAVFLATRGMKDPDMKPQRQANDAPPPEPPEPR
jgi:hypothetical protein